MNALRRFHIVRLDSIGSTATVAESSFPGEAVLRAFPDCGELRAIAHPITPELSAFGGIGAVNVYAGHDDCRYVVQEVGTR